MRLENNLSLTSGVASLQVTSMVISPKGTGIKISRPGRELSFPKQVYLWGRVKSMDANVQIRSEMCV